MTAECGLQRLTSGSPSQPAWLAARSYVACVSGSCRNDTVFVGDVSDHRMMGEGGAQPGASEPTPDMLAARSKSRAGQPIAWPIRARSARLSHQQTRAKPNVEPGRLGVQFSRGSDGVALGLISRKTGPSRRQSNVRSSSASNRARFDAS